MRLRQAPFRNSSPLLESLQLKYKKALKRTRLRSLTLQTPQDISSKSYLSYPPSLKKLSISSYFLITSFSMNLSHLPNLSTLHINLPISFLHLLDTLRSLTNPHNLTHLTARVSDAFNRATEQTFKLPESLIYFQHLYSLNLEIKSFLFASSLLKSFKDQKQLQQLALKIPIQNEEELLELAASIESFPNLSHLAIKNHKSIQGRASEGHGQLFDQISGLKKLISLEINLYGEKTAMPSSGMFHGCLGKFAACIERLNELQELIFTQSEICLEEELHLLAEILEKKGSSLKKLWLGFVSGSHQSNHLEIFNAAIASIKSLEELRLEGLCTRKESLAEFCDAFSRLKWLKSLYFDFVETGLDQVEFTRVMREILMKYGLEELRWFGDANIKAVGKTEPIDIKEVLLRNPRLQRIALRSFIRDNKILNFVNKDMITNYI